MTIVRHPNGYGSIYKLSGKRRRPFIVRKTTGWDEDGTQLFQTLGYFERRDLAIKFLAEYNANPYDVNSSITFSELYEKLMNRKTSKISDSNIKGYKMAYSISQPLHDLKFTEIRAEHMQNVIDSCGKSYETVKKMKTLYNQLYDYAMEHDIVKKKYSEYISMPEKEQSDIHKPFTKEEIDALWENVDKVEYVDMVLILIYTGFRIGELILIKNDDINMKDEYFKGGIKTAAGKGRIVPFNKKIVPLIKSKYEQGHEYFIVNAFNKQMKYENFYREKWPAIIDILDSDHLPHDCRHTCATLLDNAGANKLCIKRILGHASGDITDKVYTHKDIEELRKAINLI
jgi:integrase